jgi:hypothetical protein
VHEAETAEDQHDRGGDERRDGGDAGAQGLRRRTALTRHALRCALIPTATLFAYTMITLFTGATLMEICSVRRSATSAPGVVRSENCTLRRSCHGVLARISTVVPISSAVMVTSRIVARISFRP